MTIRPAAAFDVPAIVTLVNGAYRGEGARAGWTHEADLVEGQRTDEAMVATLWAAGPGAILVLETASAELAGCVAVAPTDTPDVWSLGMLSVAPGLQGGGMGRRLLAAGEDFAAVRGAVAIAMTVIATRVPLIGYYERRGYRLTGDDESFPYGNDRFGRPLIHDLRFVVMRKSLVATANGPQHD